MKCFNMEKDLAYLNKKFLFCFNFCCGTTTLPRTRRHGVITRQERARSQNLYVKYLVF